MFLFHSRFRVLFIFPSQYLFTIGKWLVFRITQWSGQIQTGLHVSRPTQDTHKCSWYLRYGGFALFAIFFQKFLLYQNALAGATILESYNPIPKDGLSSSPFAHHYLGNHFVFFSSCYWDVSLRKVRLSRLLIHLLMTYHKVCRISTFRDPGIATSYRLPQAYRRLARLSSPSISKKSTSSPLFIHAWLTYF